MDFREALKNIYLGSPCQVLPNALWKTFAALEGCDTALQFDENGQVCHLEICQGKRLLTHWDRNRASLDLRLLGLADLEFALLHQDTITPEAKTGFSRQTAYFRLEFRGDPNPAVLPRNFHFRTADPMHEAEAVSDLICRCYQDIHPSPETVQSWTHHPVFSPDLWVWVWDETSDKPAGLGIAEYDPSIREGSLEWIQCLPDYRGRGIGQALVNELLMRLHDTANFVTVSGQVDNRTRPEQLYRRCGFSGEDIWWVLSRQ